MTPSTREHYHAVVVTPKGEFFGSLQGVTFNETVQSLRQEGKHNLVVDLGETTLMDSSGIGVLLSTADALRQEGGDLRLARVEEKMRNLFLMTRLLGEVFTLHRTVKDAVDSFALEPAMA
ncbi:MAG: STAS domain-containing protein [Rhodothermaceae bacterium]|nr:STAS domain-containing protein [Rhodothermaceae bacterium]